MDPKIAPSPASGKKARGLRLAAPAIFALSGAILAASCLASPSSSSSGLLLADGWERWPGLMDEAAMESSDLVPERARAALVSRLFGKEEVPAGPCTYRTKARVETGAGQYALSVFGASQYRAIYIDGREMARSGSGFVSLSDIRFVPGSSEVSIVIQSDAGGPRLEDPGVIPRAVLFGKAEDVETYLLVSTGLAAAAMGVFVLGGLFMFLLFLFWKKNRDFLSLALFMFAAATFVIAKTGGCFGLLDAPMAIGTAALVATACLQAMALARLTASAFPGRFSRAAQWVAGLVPAAIGVAAVAIPALALAFGSLPVQGLEYGLYIAGSAWYAFLGLSLLVWLTVAVAKGDHRARWYLPALAVACATMAAHRLFPGSPGAAFFLEPLGLAAFCLVCMLMLVKKIGDSFESAEVLTDYVASVSTTMKRFIPTEFLRCLDKSDVIDLRLGDHVRKEMTIFFSDIRSFTELSERLTVEENFNFINSYLSRMVPIVTANGGFVDKYIGDGIMALFEGDTGPDAAIRTAISMQEKMVEYNGHRAKMGYRPISMGVGIHTGDLMLGVIGVDSRMENTVISDAVNLSSRLQSITKAFNVSLAISEQSLQGARGSRRLQVPLHRQGEGQGQGRPRLRLRDLRRHRPRALRAQDEGQHLLRAGHALVLPEGLRRGHVLFQAGPRDHPRGRSGGLLPPALHGQGYHLIRRPTGWGIKKNSFEPLYGLR